MTKFTNVPLITFNYPHTFRRFACSWAILYSPYHQQLKCKVFLWLHINEASTLAYFVLTSYQCMLFDLEIVFFSSKDYHSRPWPASSVVRGTCRYAKVVGSVSDQGSYKEQPMNTYVCGTTNWYFSLSLSFSLINKFLKSKSLQNDRACPQFTG